jgi:hypothetical protein|tara:strand:- start:59 stop:559 length:501 start_codon:yes stop_codon:yes gene_type:complete
MGKYLQAKEVVKDSFWIVERNGTKIGTLRRKTDSYILYENNSRTETVLDNLDDIKFTETDTKNTINVSIYGYPTNVDTVFNTNLQDDVAVYTKTANSKQYFVAGYWGILFPMGWRPSFCPRLKTLQDYTNLGPFKNESDMYLAIKRKGQENEKTNTSTTNSADMLA